MGHSNSLAILVALTVGGVTSAFAGAGIVSTTVAPVGTNVTYSKLAAGKTPALNTYVGYTVSIGSDASNTNTINNVVFTATTSVTDGDEAAEFSSVEGASCAVAANPAGSPVNARSISCAIGQLRAGQSYPPFVVFFKAPVKDTATPTTPDNIRFSGITYYAEGTGGLQSPPQNSTVPWSAADVLLGTPNPVLIKSAVQKSGGTLFTGDGVSTGSNPFTTAVTVPPAVTYSKAQIDVSPNAVNCTNFSSCYQAQVSVLDPTTGSPATFSPYLTVVLRQDAATIVKGTKIESVTLVYTDAGSTEHIVGLCASPTTPRTDGIPCIANRVYYKNKGVSGWTTDLDGDFEWTLININNGGYKVL